MDKTQDARVQFRIKPDQKFTQLALAAMAICMGQPAFAACTSNTQLKADAAVKYIGGTSTLTATMTKSGCSSAAGLKGRVDFYDKNVVVGSSSVTNTTANQTTASFTTKPAYTAVGPHSFSASFVSTSLVVPSSKSSDVVVTIKAKTTSALSVSTSTANASQSVTLKATVKQSAGTTLPTGAVQFFDGTKSLGSAALDSTGEASLVVNNWTTGTHTLTANYVGATYFDASASANTSLTVTAAPSVTSIEVSPRTPREGEPVTITAVVQGSSPTGTVTFTDGNVSLGNPVAVSGGKAQYSTIFKIQGTHNVKAKYAGDANNLASESSSPSVLVNGRDYYFDSAASEDASTTGYADRPLRNFGALTTRLLPNGAPLSLTGNDRLLLKCGAEFRDQLTINPTNATASAGSKLYIGSWGNNCTTARPVINAAERLDSKTTWAAAPELGAYQTTLSSSVNAQILQLLRDANGVITALPMTRYPKAGSIPSVLTIAATSPDAPRNQLITSPADFVNLGGKSIEGALLHIRTQPYRFEERTVSSVGSNASGQGVISIGQHPDDESNTVPTAEAISAGYGYVLAGKDWMLTAPDRADFEWSFNPGSKLLKVVMPSGTTPASVVLEASVREHGISVAGVPVSIENIDIKNAAQDGIALDNSPNSTVSNVRVSHSRRNGIVLDRNDRAGSGQGFNASNDTVISASAVSFSGTNGIYSRLADNVSLLNNTITDTGTSSLPRDTESGLYIEAGAASNVTGNLVQRSAHHGIRVQNSAQTIAQGNTVEDSCLSFDDCAGIYVYAFSGNLPPDDENSVTKILDNTVKRTQPKQLVGLPQKDIKEIAAGIYLDDAATNVQMDNNSVSHAGMGALLHNNRLIKVRGNTFAANRNACVEIRNNSYIDPETSEKRVHDFSEINVSGNFCAPGATTGYYGHGGTLDNSERLGLSVRVLDDANSADVINAALSFENNRYLALYGAPKFGLDIAQGRHYDIQGWVAKYPTETQIGPANRAFALYKATVAASAVDLITNGDFSNGVASGWDRTSSIVAMDAATCGGSPCAARPIGTPASIKTETISFGFMPTDGSTYLLKYRLKTQEPTNPSMPPAAHQVLSTIGLHCEPYWAHSAGYRVINSPTSDGWTSYEWPVLIGGVNSACPTNGVRMSFSTQADANLMFDDVSFKPATVDMNLQADEVVMLSNTSNITQNAACPNPARCTQYVDENRNPVAFPLSIQPNATRLLLWSGSLYYMP